MAAGAKVQEALEGEWLLARQAFPELDRRASLATAEYLGGLAVYGEVEMSPVETESNETTLLAAIQLAALGDKSSEKVLEDNIAPDILERLFKVGVFPPKSMRFKDSHLTQHDRRVRDIQGNTLKFAVLNSEMLQRTRTELGNIDLFGALYEAGVLKTHNAAVFSPASKNKQTLKDYNFFLGTESCSIQLLSTEGDEAVLETAMVAGKKTPASPRHDIEAIHTLAEDEGLEIHTYDTGEMIHYVMLIPKSQTKNGVSDVVKRYDGAVGGTFYGEDKPTRDYEEFAAECIARSENFSSIVQQIKEQLMSEAHAFSTPLEAIERLDYLSERLCVKRARYDTSIDVAVFGPVAARHVEDARFFESINQHDRAEDSMRRAQETAQSGSCPLDIKAKEAADKMNSSAGDEQEQGSGKKWMNCPYCSARVYDDPCAKVLSCWDCKACVSDGKVLSKGNGGAQKRRTEQAAKEAERKAQEAIAGKQVDTMFSKEEIAMIEQEEKLKIHNAGGVALAGVQA